MALDEQALHELRRPQAPVRSSNDLLERRMTAGEHKDFHRHLLLGLLVVVSKMNLPAPNDSRRSPTKHRRRTHGCRSLVVSG
jgi:hypothetical protein